MDLTKNIMQYVRDLDGEKMYVINLQKILWNSILLIVNFNLNL